MKKQMFWLVTVLFITVLSLSSCDTTSEEGTGTWDLTGTWKTGCAVTGTGTPAESKINTITFINNTFTLVEDVYTTTDCSGGITPGNFNGTYTTGIETTTSDSGVAVKKIDLTFSDNSKQYSIYRIEGSQLYFGSDDATLDGSTDAKRPTTLNTGRPYMKQ